MGENRGGHQSVSDRAARSACRCADVAQSLASTLERVAVTDRWMAERARSPDMVGRLVGHATWLEDRADYERVEAMRLRHVVEASCWSSQRYDEH